MNTSTPLAHIFVYGTLKRGQVRERCLPRQPISIEPAWTLGRLHDLGPYPAMTEGTDRVLGELWQFAPDDLPQTLKVLDGIEGFRSAPGDVYTRVVAECTSETGQVTQAFTYRYARPIPDSARLVTVNPSGVAVWP